MNHFYKELFGREVYGEGEMNNEGAIARTVRRARYLVFFFLVFTFVMCMYI